MEQKKSDEKSLLARNIKYFCELRCINYTELVKKAEIPRQTLDTILYYGSGSLKCLETIARVLDTTRYELLNSEKHEEALNREVFLKENMRLLSLLKGIDRKELTRITGISYKIIRNVYNGEYSFSSNTLSLIADAFGVSKYDLLYYDFSKGRKECVGENLRALRTENNMSIAKLYQISDVSVYSISKMEKSGKIMRLRSIKKLADALGVSCEMLLFGSYSQREI